MREDAGQSSVEEWTGLFRLKGGRNEQTRGKDSNIHRIVDLRHVHINICHTLGLVVDCGVVLV